jgi:hypothetical protein
MEVPTARFSATVDVTSVKDGVCSLTAVTATMMPTVVDLELSLTVTSNE